MNTINNSNTWPIHRGVNNCHTQAQSQRDFTMEILYCIETGCKHERKEKKNKRGDYILMTQCTTCHAWYHDECVGIDSNAKLTAWPCPICRAMPLHVKQLIAMVQQLTATVNTMHEDLKEAKKDIHTNTMEVQKIQKCVDVTNAEGINIQENDVQNTAGSLLKKIDQHTKQLIERTAPDADESDNETDEDDDEPLEAKGNLLIGDSMIRDIAPLSEDLVVESHGGAKYNDIRKCLKQVNPKKTKYKNIYIVCGTNDIATRKPIEKIAKDCEKLVLEAQSKAETVCISSILPRLDDERHVTKIDNLNQILTTMANSNDAKFINNDKNFKYRDDSTDASLLSPVDKLHLSHQGVMKLLQNLQLDKDAKAAIGNMSNKWKNASQTAAKKDYGQNKRQESTPPFIPPEPPQTNDWPIIPSPDCNTRSPQQVPNLLIQSLDDDIEEHRFRGKQSPLSNFFEAPITIWGIRFRSSEHSYQYRKAVTMNQSSAANQILNAKTPRDAKSIGDSVHASQGWLNIRQGIMYQILRQKAMQCREFRDCLVATSTKRLVEDTTDIFWGRGKSGEGLNALGQLLMSLRSNLPNITNDDYAKNTASSQPTQQREQIRCFNCAERSHTVSKCRHSHPLRCFSCNGEGHKQKMCPQKKQQDSDYRNYKFNSSY